MLRLGRLLVFVTVTVLSFHSALEGSPLTIANPDFAVPTIPCALGYAYQGSGDCNSTVGLGDPIPQQDFNSVPGVGWTFGEGTGLTAPNSPFQPPSFDGLPFGQAAFLQDAGSSISQVVPGFGIGTTYVLTFYLGSRFNDVPNDGSQTVAAFLDGALVGSWELDGFTPFEVRNVTFQGTTNGSETLTFEGLAVGDHTAFLSHVSISSVPEPGSMVLLAVGLAILASRLKNAA